MSFPLMDESITLDEDGVLSSPSLSSPAEPEPPLGPPGTASDVGESATAEPDPARILAEAKSMENILLETAEGTTGSDSAPAVGAATVAGPETSAPTTPQENTKKQGSPTSGDVDQVGDAAMTSPHLSSYFGSANPESNEASSFFDQISGSGGQPSATASPPLGTGMAESSQAERVSAMPPGTQAQGEVIRERTLSVASEEATPVSFEEVKGSGLKFVGSMESVTKFFNETSGTGVEESEGKEFFDSFTAGATGDLAAQPAAPPSGDGVMSNPVSPPVAVPSGGPSSLPPETPPIPHEPMSMSPLPSPIHTNFMRQRSISQSQASPAPSPIHSAAAPPDVTPSGDPDAVLQTAFPPSTGSINDVFSAGLAMSDADRRRDAWIPTETTRQSLVAMVTSTSGAFPADSEQLTTPGVSPTDPLGDPVQELVQRFMGEAEANKRITLTVDDVTEDAEGLRKLINAECWRSAADLSAKLLENHDQGVGSLGQPSKHSPESLQTWFCRIALLIKLRLYTHADVECQAFGTLDRPDLYYEFYPDTYPGRRGSMVPFAFRILYAELPQYLGKSQESLDRLYYVQAITKKILANLESGLAEDGSMIQLSDESRKASHDLWMQREVQLQYAIGNCLLSNKDYSMAIDIFEGLLKNDENAEREDILCGIGRIYLQMGDVKTAQRYFSRAETASDSTNQHVKCRNLMNKGFVALGQNLFSEAYNYFKQATMIKPENAVAVNNMAVCSLYMGRLRDALTTLESLVHENPARYLQEGILFNLCTLYELESSRALHKKQALLQLVSKHKGNGFNTACLKMT